jgi:hypothetical protein
VDSCVAVIDVSLYRLGRGPVRSCSCVSQGCCRVYLYKNSSAVRRRIVFKLEPDIRQTDERRFQHGRPRASSQRAYVSCLYGAVNCGQLVAVCTHMLQMRIHTSNGISLFSFTAAISTGRHFASLLRSCRYACTVVDGHILKLSFSCVYRAVRRIWPIDCLDVRLLQPRRSMKWEKIRQV